VGSFGWGCISFLFRLFSSFLPSGIRQRSDIVTIVDKFSGICGVLDPLDNGAELLFPV
jgi:hypothetical protein